MPIVTISTALRAISLPKQGSHRKTLTFSWDSPDDSRTGVNIIAFPSSLEDRREVRTATGTLGQPERWSSGRSGHFPWHWHGSIRRDCLDHVVVLGDRLVGCCKLDRKRNSVQFFTDLSDDRGVRIGKLESSFHEQSAGKLRASATESCLAVGGLSSGDRRCTCSPSVRNSSRLVARTRTLGAPLSVSTAKAAAASITCSQLSSTSIFRLMPRS
jgi:hypothetical protein